MILSYSLFAEDIPMQQSSVVYYSLQRSDIEIIMSRHYGVLVQCDACHLLILLWRYFKLKCDNP